MPKIIETPERMVYEAVSEGNKAVKYRVDLLANGGAGRCSCVDFATRRQPAIDAGQEWLLNITTCKHLREAIRQFNVSLFKRMSVEEDQSL